MRVCGLGIEPEHAVAIFAFNFCALPHIHINFGMPEGPAAAVASHAAFLNNNDVVLSVGFI